MTPKSKFLTRIVSLALLTSAACFADVVTGTFFVNDTATVGLTSISFTNVKVSAVEGADPSLPAVGDAVTVQTLTQATTPIGETFPVSPFANWLTVGDVALDLTFLPTGVSTPAPIGTGVCGISGGAVGDTCTPEIPALVSPGNPLGLSNFNLQNIAGNAFTASFTVEGMARDLDGGPNNVDSFTGSFSATLPGTYQNALGAIAAGGPQQFLFTGQLTMTAIPEPSFLPILGGIGIAAIAVSLFRKRRTA